MGSSMSEEEQRERVRRDVERAVRKFKKRPDVTVNGAVVMFSSTSSSSDDLQEHLNKRTERDDPPADWIKTLAETLAGLSPSPKLAGLGALAIAILIDTMSDVSSSDAMKDALRCVFAEEKASEVWDQINECLKRCVMHTNDDGELKNDIKRIERQLSAALTKLKNSMLRDGHMSSQALKAWVNGAPFHVQMLIHLVRLGGIQTCDPAERLLSAYLSDLDPLFKKHKEAVRRRCKVGYHNCDDCPSQYFENEDGEGYYISRFIRFNDIFEGYYEEHYSSQQCEIRNYLRRVRDDLPWAVRQVGHLRVSPHAAALT